MVQALPQDFPSRRIRGDGAHAPHAVPEARPEAPPAALTAPLARALVAAAARAGVKPRDVLAAWAAVNLLGASSGPQAAAALGMGEAGAKSGQRLLVDLRAALGALALEGAAGPAAPPPRADPDRTPVSPSAWGEGGALPSQGPSFMDPETQKGRRAFGAALTGAASAAPAPRDPRASGPARPTSEPLSRSTLAAAAAFLRRCGHPEPSVRRGMAHLEARWSTHGGGVLNPTAWAVRVVDDFAAAYLSPPTAAERAAHGRAAAAQLVEQLRAQAPAACSRCGRTLREGDPCGC